MRWMNKEAPGHEAWIVKILNSGRDVGGECPQGVWPAGEPETPMMDWDFVTWWQIKCSCGWMGSPTVAYAVDGDGRRECPPEVAEQFFEPQWRRRFQPNSALIELDRYAMTSLMLQSQLDDAVDEARRAGSSWNQIGNRLGMTKQAAHQRWGSIPDVEELEHWVQLYRFDEVRQATEVARKRTTDLLAAVDRYKRTICEDVAFVDFINEMPAFVDYARDHACRHVMDLSRLKNAAWEVEDRLGDPDPRIRDLCRYLDECTQAHTTLVAELGEVCRLFRNEQDRQGVFANEGGTERNR